MAPQILYQRQAGPVLDSQKPNDWDWRAVAQPEDLVLESWSQGFVVGSLLLMACITAANMRRGVLLHKLILLEQLMALTHGTFCFMDFKGYGWYLSSTAALLYLSYILHNVVAWMKVKPFFHGRSTIFKGKFVKRTTLIYKYTLWLTVPAILFQITDNFRFFNGYGGWYTSVRPYEPLMRDPWWVFCCCVLFYVVSKSYGMGILNIIKRSPRFGILFISIILALIFTALDIVASIHSFIGSTDGINPFWKLSLVFKCLTDAILLDDFKTELKRLGLKRMKRDEKRRDSFALVIEDNDRYDSDDEAAAHYSNGSIASPDRANGYQPRPRKISDEESSEQVEQVGFLAALQTHPSYLSSDRESRRSSASRAQIGRGGTPATKLPRFFAAIKPGKGKSDDEEPAKEVVSMRRAGSMERDVAPDEITYVDDSLERAKMEQQRTIDELKRRKEANRQGFDSTSPDAVERVRQQKKKASISRDFWDGIDDLDDDEPSSSRHV